jgi:SAM-dependent methyltransferase
MVIEAIKYSEYFQSNEKVDFYLRNVYQQDAHSSKIWQIEQEYLAKVIQDYVRDKTNVRYLDFACGAGRIIRFIEEYMDYSVGVDISGAMLIQARKHVKKSVLKEMDIIKEEMGQTFDVITSFRFFLNAEDSLRTAVLKSILKLMNENTIFIFSIQGNKFSLRGIVYLIKRILRKPGFNQLSHYGVKRMLQRNGFRVVGLDGMGFLPGAFYKIKRIKDIVFFIDKLIYRMKFLNLFSHNLIFLVKKMD